MSISKEVQESIIKMGYQFAWSQLIHDRVINLIRMYANIKVQYQGVE